MTIELKHLKLWTLPENYFGAIWPDYYSAGVGQSRDSDAVERSNFRVMWNALKDFDGTQIVRENHFLVGWVEWIALPADNPPALKTADDLLAKLDAYPVLDEMDLSEEESEEAEEIWTNCYSTKERIQYVRDNREQFDFVSLSQMLACVRGKGFAGYPSELIYR